MRPPAHRGLCLRPGGKGELLEVGSGNAEGGIVGSRNAELLEVGILKWDPSSSQKNGTMPRHGCGSRNCWKWEEN